MTIINLVNLLDSTFVNSFKHTAQVLYSVSFETSNVSKIRDKLIELEYNVSNEINTGKHVGAQITIQDVRIVSETLKALVLHYEFINGIAYIPSNLKIHDMIKVIREHEKPSVNSIAKEVLNEILKPSKTKGRLTKKQELKNQAEKKSEERKLKIIKNLNK